ncbi:MAG: LEA type 2 family protein [Candidatus Coatesbacteria bacterium]|nr:LEA type 2 family protein [Candidatus Coatesbacteria bacterium]
MVFLVLVLSGCGTIKPQQPVIKSLKGLSFEKIDGEVIKLNATWEVYNPNSFAISIPRINYKVLLENKEIGEGEKTSSFILDAKKKTDISTPLDVSIIKLLKLIPDLIKKEKLNYQLLGNAIFEIKEIKIEVPFENKGIIDLKPAHEWVKKYKEKIIPKEMKDIGKDVIKKGKELFK